MHSGQMDDPRRQSHRPRLNATSGAISNELPNSGGFFKTLKSYQSRPARLSDYTSDLLLPTIRDEELASKASATSSKVPLTPNSAISCASTSQVCLNVSSVSSAEAPTVLPYHVLSLTYCGEEFTYDLKTLEDDPRPITELLKATLSERGRWMMVGAHYRRSGNPHAAISVVENMIQFMTGEGYSEDDLKPAFILLSGCETDLAKRAKASQSSDAEEHYQKSQAWLQKVYGKFEQEIIPKGKTSETLSIPWHRRAQYSPGSRAHDGILLSPEYSAEESAREIRLERRLQALLDERKEQAVILAETRAAKRKLEEGFMFECDRRRRLLREYDGLQKELATARKMEDYALSQVKREVETRRKAEEIARAERSMRLEIQALFEQTAAPPFTEIANTMRMDDGPPAATFKATNAS